MIIITDAHVSKIKGNDASFLKMLKALEKNSQDLIFLGDIFDLWIALPRYEDDIHREFISWCREQKKHRTIGYMAGNHEFYMTNESARAFTWYSQDAWQEGKEGILFVHGDQINRKDRKYLYFRILARSHIVKFIVRYLPLGPKVVEFIKEELKKTNLEFRLGLPKEEIEFFAEARFAEGADTIFVGHFHQEYTYRNRESRELHILPDWYRTQKVTVYRRNPKKITFLHWKDL